MKGNIVKVPEDAPVIGETYRHYKGDLYQIVELALHSNDDEWMVVYKPLYENPDANLFTRPLREWREEVEWKGEKKVRFVLIENGD
ncbi:MAG: DUF1653 domain-containing protein [Candidatus Pacebacteria bacterium]|nr:DUF1653 domain-containing protein [Candidatus Paceibacterota bacterium]MCF7857438.1 DUF1653 domain-containing protein [Candidatus Paceibacterota bacterium]